jgi:transformation/transcription domain-associated protein
MQPDDTSLMKATSSFKVLTECPIIIALLFQLHKDHISNQIPVLFEPIIRVLILQPAHQLQEHIDASNKGTIFLGKSPKITNAALYADYKSLQVKVFQSLN